MTAARPAHPRRSRRPHGRDGAPRAVMCHSHRNAFTLLEVILAIAITAMLALALYGSLRTAMKARDSAEAAVEPARAAQIALSLIGRDLESALPPTGVLAGSFEGVDGGPDIGDSVSYYTLVNGADGLDPTGNDGIKNVQLLVAPEGPDNVNCLVRRVTGNLLADQDPVPADEVLIRDVTRFNVTYIADDVPYDDWDSTAYSDTLPAIVHIDIETHKPGTPDDAVRRFSRSYLLACAPPPGSAAATTGGTTQ